MNLKYIKITDPESSEFKKICELYEASFSEDQRRCIDNKKKLLVKDNYSLYYICENKKFIGFLIEWKLSTFKFIEHFAVNDKYRGNGYGSEILKNFLTNTPVILEVGIPKEGEVDNKVINFYEKLGFKLNPYKYIQPAYEANKNPVPLYLMTYPEYLDKVKFMLTEQEIHKQVYDHKK